MTGRSPGVAALLAAALALIFACLSPAGAWAAPKFPALTGRVVDDANVLPPATEAELTSKLEQLQAKTSRQLAVVTLASLQGYDIADYGYQLGRAWGIGQKGTNNGVLLIVAPNEHKTRIEVGYGLEPILTDALTSVILNRAVLPRFKAGDVPGGVVAGTDALIEQLSLDPSAAEQRAVAAQAAREQQSETGGQGSPSSSLWTFVIILVVLFFLFGGRRRRRRGLGGLGGLWPLIFMGGGGRGGGWSDGGGFGGGGGFSGGGGSFGGGGSSGSW